MAAENGKPPPDKQESVRDELGRFKPGVSGNPRGRPKGPTVTETLRKMLEEIDDTTKLTRREAVAKRLLLMAIKGDMRALSYLVDRVDGKAKDTLVLEDEAPERDESYL